MEWSLIESPLSRHRMVPIWYQFLTRPPRNSLIQQIGREMDQLFGREMQQGYTNISQGRELEVKHDNKVFEVKLGVSNFQPEEIEVKVNEQDRMLVINAKHEEKRDDHGFISRQFSRQIYIPENVEEESMESMLTNDGNLVVRAKVKADEGAKPQERMINIQREEPKQIKE